MTALPSPTHMPGSRWMPPAPGPTRHALVTARQADVLTGLCLGFTNRRIGRSLGVAEDTVKTHVRRVLHALGARDRCHAVALVASGEVIPIVTNWSQS